MRSSSWLLWEVEVKRPFAQIGNCPSSAGELGSSFCTLEALSLVQGNFRALMSQSSEREVPCPRSHSEPLTICTQALCRWCSIHCPTLKAVTGCLCPGENRGRRWPWRCSCCIQHRQQWLPLNLSFWTCAMGMRLPLGAVSSGLGLGIFLFPHVSSRDISFWLSLGAQVFSRKFPYPWACCPFYALSSLKHPHRHQARLSA